MEWKEVLEKITSIAPAVGSVFGAPGYALGTVIKSVAGAFGLSDTAKPEDIMAAIEKDKDAYLKLQIAKQTYDLEVMKNETEKLKLELADTQSARTREAEITKVTGKRDSQLMILAWIGVLLPFSLIFAMIKWGIPDMSTEEALMVGGFVGIIVGEYKTIFGYFFGSSRGSAEKSNYIEGIRNSIAKKQ